MEEILISKNTERIDPASFEGRLIGRVTFEANGFSYSFPSHKFFNKELLKSFGQNGLLYDFTEYDKFLLRPHFNADRIRMICERLTQPWNMAEGMRQKLFSHVYDDLGEALSALAKENAIDELRLMAGAGFFDGTNIDHAIEVLNNTDRRELLSVLMDYKHEHLPSAEFDFSI